MAPYTIWWCKGCRASGVKDLNGLGVYDAIYHLEEAHNGHVLAAIQHCTFAAGQVQVKEAPASSVDVLKDDRRTDIPAAMSQTPQGPKGGDRA